MTRLQTMFASGAALLLASCGAQPRNDAGAPPENFSTEPPAWANQLQVEHVGWITASVRNTSGHSVRISKDGTDLDGGLSAFRAWNVLSVRDQQGVACSWNEKRLLQGCVIPNQAYGMYLGMRASGFHF